MNRSQTVLLMLLLSLFTLYACKSVETTSAMLHNQHGQYDKAIEMANLALDKNPNDAEAHFQLGISYSFKGMMRDAYEKFMMAATLDPNKLTDTENNIKHNWAKHFNNGVNEYQSENYKGAAKEFDLATQADPRQSKGWLNLAKVYSLLSHQDSTYLEHAFSISDTLLLKVTKEDDEYTDALALAGKLMIRRGDKERAIGIFEKLMLDDPANFETVEGIGGDLINDKDWEYAAIFLEMATDGQRETDSENFATYYDLGVSHYNMQDYMKAIDAYQNALRLRPDEQLASYSLLLTYYMAELWDEAIATGQDYTTRIAPDDPKGWQILSRSYNKNGLKIKAEEAYQKFRELSQ